jgi:hypothetical protein
MERSEIRGCFITRENPGLRCAPSGLRLLTAADATCANRTGGVSL